MTPRRGVSPVCSMNSATSCRCCARRPIPKRCPLQGVVARRMHAAVAPFASDQFITPMAAVAGAVAEEILGAMLRNGAASPRLCQQWRRHRAASWRRRAFYRWPGGPAGRAWRDANHHRRCRRSHPRHCDLRTPRPQFFARHCRRGDGAGANRVAGRCRRHHHCQCGRSARTPRHRSLPGKRAAARQRSRRAAGHPRRRPSCPIARSRMRWRQVLRARAGCSPRD